MYLISFGIICIYNSKYAVDDLCYVSIMIMFQVSFIIFLFSVKSNSSTPYNNVRKVKGATEDITF